MLYIMRQEDLYQMKKFIKLYHRYGMYKERIDNVCVFRDANSARSVSITNDLLEILIKHINTIHVII